MSAQQCQQATTLQAAALGEDLLITGHDAKFSAPWRLFFGGVLIMTWVLLALEVAENWVRDLSSTESKGQDFGRCAP